MQMKRNSILSLTPFFFFFYVSVPGQNKALLQTPFEKHKTNYSASYEECRDWYKSADSAYQTIQVNDYGLTDGGHPLQLAIYSADKDFDPVSLHHKNKMIILIMNAIHPGEPEGVDASMLLLRDIATNNNWTEIMKNVVVCIIPQYNLEGVINRNAFSRVNQNGPEQYGFRGNGENLDLNRDFIKCDSKNTKVFESLFRDWNPDVFIDNHTSDGADYQYTLTYISSMQGSLTPELENYVRITLTPAIDKRCSRDGFDMVPYVECMKESPDSGIAGFASTPRYSTGYTSLWNTISYTVETHMLKPFDQRLKATYSFMQACIYEVHTDAEKIKALRNEAIENRIKQNEFVLQRQMDTTKFELIDFKGYEAMHKPSLVTGAMRLYYDREKPYSRKIRYYDHFNETLKVIRPEYYIVPFVCQKTVELLKLNRIEMQQLKKDTSIHLEMYVIDDYDNNPGKTPSNGHYMHRNIKLHSISQDVEFHKGDYIVSTRQEGIAYIMSVLEPQGADSYFAWNMFDGILQEREYYSDYVFEDVAFRFLEQNPDVKNNFENKKKSDKAFASSPKAQIDWIYRQSPYFEKTYMRYPVGRIMH